MDTNTVTENISFLDKIKSAFGGLIFGLILFLGSFVLLWWNEGNYVKTVELNNYVAKKVVDVDYNVANPINNGKLVHVSGKATSSESLIDRLDVEVRNAISLSRDVEMYQWVEDKKTNERKNMGGSSTKSTTYTYSKKWSKRLIDSASFNQSQDHQNPSSFKVPSEKIYAKNVKFGAFDLSENQIKSITSKVEITKLPDNNYFKNSGGQYYYGNNELNPQIGDLKITYSYVPSDTPISIIAEQNNNNLIPAIIANKEFSNVTMGIASAKQIMNDLAKQNVIVTWLLRVLGIVLMYIGLSMLIAPITVLADIIPLLSYFVEAISGIILFMISLALGVITIAIAWFAYRPFISIPIIAILGYCIYRVMNKKEEVANVSKRVSAANQAVATVSEKTVVRDSTISNTISNPEPSKAIGKLVREDSRISVLCPNCEMKYGAEIKADSQIVVRNFEDENLNQQGQQIVCIKCGQEFTVPQK